MIDILMSTFNGGKYLKPQIDSILDQSFGEFRLIIRDDGSTDDTTSILEEYAGRDGRVHLAVDQCGNMGARRSFMRLLENSRSEYFMFADQDDVWLPEKISKSRDSLLRMAADLGNDKPLLVFTDLKVADENLEIFAPSLWRYQKLDPRISSDWRRLLAQNVVTGCTIMGNRMAAEAAIPFTLPYMIHDHWIAVNAAKSGRIAFLTEPTVIYRQHASNVEGGRRFDFRYALKKLPALAAKPREFRLSAGYFGDVSAAGIMARKLWLNLRRFSRQKY